MIAYNPITEDTLLLGMFIVGGFLLLTAICSAAGAVVGVLMRRSRDRRTHAERKASEQRAVEAIQAHTTHGFTRAMGGDWAEWEREVAQ